MDSQNVEQTGFSVRTHYQLHVIAPDSAIGRWIARQDSLEFSLEEALADFAYQLRMGSN